MGKKQGGNRKRVQHLYGGPEAGGEPCGSLLAPVAYFKRYGENLTVTITPYEAWLRTESEFIQIHSTSSIVLRRYLKYTAFRDAFRRHMDGKTPRYIKIHLEIVK